MQGTITSVQKQNSYYGGSVYLITFSGENNCSYRTWVHTGCGNYRRWQHIIEKGKGTAVGNLNVKAGRLINADSFPKIEE